MICYGGRVRKWLYLYYDSADNDDDPTPLLQGNIMISYRGCGGNGFTKATMYDSADNDDYDDPTPPLLGKIMIPFRGRVRKCMHLG